MVVKTVDVEFRLFFLTAQPNYHHKKNMVNFGGFLVSKCLKVISGTSGDWGRQDCSVRDA